ncbi:MAG: hypothetical protein OHK0022_45640 [Roseiflexaceae bacterium]
MSQAKRDHRQQRTPALVVGISASAGGVEALQTFFAHVPTASGCAYVVVLHRSPEHDSQLATLLQAVAPIPVILVTERLCVEPDHAYIVPPNQHPSMVDGELHVSPNVEPEDRRAPVDVFFRTLADSHDARGVCVILSGSGSDGSIGLKRVKKRGGVVFVQNPHEAAFAEMPQTAIATDLVDDVLPAAEIPARIVAYQASLGTVSIVEELQSINEELRMLNQKLKVKVEEVLQTSADLQNLVNATGIATIFLDRQLRIKRCTPAARELFNLIPPDQGRPLDDLTHQLCDIDLLAEAARVLTTLQSVEHEVRDVDGRAYILRVLPYRADDDRIGGVVLTLFDITERKRIERALAEQARLLDLSNDAIIVRDVGNRILYWNHGATELYGWSREEAIGQDLHTLLQTEFEAPFAQLIAALHKHDRLEGEVVQSTRDGRRITALCRWSLDRDAEGQPGAILTTYNDITPRKRAEETLRASEARFRTLADTVPQIIWTNDPDGRATYFNQRWFAYSGRSQEESLGLGWQAIVHPDDEAASVERWRQALAASEVFEIEYRLRRADGTYRWHLGRNVPLRDGNEEVIGWFGSATDIEALKQAETAVQHARDELEQRVAERTAELRHLSSTRQELLERLVSAQEDERRHIARELHDSLGQYLTALALELVRVQTTTGTPPDVQTSLARLQRVAQEIDAELDSLTMELRPPALDDLGLDEALRRYAQQWSVTGGIPVEVIANGFGANRLPLAVEATAYRVVQEALTNVRKHAQARHVSLILERRPGELQVIVEDDGVGFQPEVVARERSGGRQLGLVGMGERATLAGGAVVIESEPGVGTTIFLRIPLASERGGAAHG